MPDRPERSGRHARRIQHRRGDVSCAGAHAEEFQVRCRHGVGRPSPVPVRGNGTFLPRRLQHKPDRRMAACPGRRRREIAERSQSRRRRLRARREHHPDGQDLPGFGVRRLRLPRRFDQGRNRESSGGGCHQRAVRGRRCGRVCGQGLRPHCLLRLSARHGRPGQRVPARTRGDQRRRHRDDRGAVRQRPAAGQPQSGGPSDVRRVHPDLRTGLPGAQRTRTRRSSR